jgi:hypothetical protein
MSFAGCKGERHRQAVGVHDGVYLARQSASRPTHMLLSIARGAGPVLVHTDNRRIDHLNRHIMSSGQHIHDPVPDSSPTPADEAVVASRRRSLALRQIAPRCARPQDPKDAVQDTPVVYTERAAWLVREHRLDDTPLTVAKLIPHDSRLKFGSLNHDPPFAIQTIARRPDLHTNRT